MLIKITNRCAYKCTHCMERSVPLGRHMERDTFIGALEFTKRVEGKAWGLGIPPFILLSGGEPTENPACVEYLETVVDQGMWPMLISNGSWLSNKELRESILRKEWPHILVQVTHDPRFYPTPPPERIEDKRVVYIESLTLLLPLGRSKNKDFDPQGLPKKQAPSSFNIRSITRSTRSIEDALVIHRGRAMGGLNGHCSPSITIDGDVVAGESNACFKVGTIHSSNEEITKNMIEMTCNRCGLVDNLTLEQKRAIGESRLYGPGE